MKYVARKHVKNSNEPHIDMSVITAVSPEVMPQL